MADDHYPTDPSLVARVAGADATLHALVSAARRGESVTVVDIGAGEGQISAALIRLGVPPSSITCIEKRPECRPALESLGVEVIVGDALALPREHAGRRWDVAIYNPPFGLWDELRVAYRPRVRHLYALGRAGMGEGAQERAASWREDQPDRYGVPERVSFVRVAYHSAETGKRLSVGGQDSAGTCWFHWGPERRTEGRVVTLRDRTEAERAYQPPTRTIYVASESMDPKVHKKAAKVRETWER